jgi:two-component system LytT family response regulator
MNTVILDDEPNCCKTLALLLKEYCKEVSSINTFYHPQKALSYLKTEPVDLLFLDIDMPGMNGFDLLDKLLPVSYPIVFTTAYDQYAIKAIKYSAFDYLLKPIDEEELVQVIDRIKQQKSLPSLKQTELLFSLYQNKILQTPERIALPTTEGFEFITTSEILRCESVSNYTRIFFNNPVTSLLVCRTLKEIEQMLGTESFLRVHNSHLIKKSFVKKYIKADGGYLLMNDGSQIPVARRRKGNLMDDLLP